jgi:hypothetical protein
MKYMIEARTVQALALHARGNLEQSLQSLQRALALAEPEGYSVLLSTKARQCRNC